MNYGQLRALAEEMVKDFPELTGVMEGTIEKSGIKTDVPCIKLGVKEKVPSWKMGRKKRLPRKIGTLRTDVVEFNPITSTGFQSGKIYNASQGWYGSLGPIVQGARGGIYAMTNHHVSPSVGDVIKSGDANGSIIGTCTHTGGPLGIDVSLIELREAQGLTDRFYAPTDVLVGDTCYWDGSFGQPSQGKVDSIGVIFVNDPILGRFLSDAVVLWEYGEWPTVISGDSGSTGYTNRLGVNYVAGVMNGNQMNFSSMVPILSVLTKFPFLVWGDDQVTIENLMRDNASLKNSLSNQVRRTNYLESVMEDFQSKRKNFLNSLDESTILELGLDTPYVK